MDGWMDRWIRLASEMGRSSPEPVVRYMIEPVGLRVVAVGFEIYAVGFLSFVGHGIRLCRLKRYEGVYVYKDELRTGSSI